MTAMKIEIGLGKLTVLLFTVLFVGLKLANIIHWPWLWVLAPIWLPFAAIGVLAVFFACLGFFLRKLEEHRVTKANRKRYGL